MFSLMPISENLRDAEIARATISTEFAEANDLPLFANSGRCPSGGGLTD